MASFRMLLAVGLGGAGGALSRWALLAIAPLDAQELVTWAINVVGSIGLGALFGRRELLAAELFAGLGTGFAGGFTTFSAFAVSVAGAIEDGRLDDALVIGLATPLVALVGAGIGYRVSRRSIRKADKARKAEKTGRAENTRGAGNTGKSGEGQHGQKGQ